MGPIGHQRIAQRFTVPTTPIQWKVPKRKGLNPRSKSVLAEAAIIEVSIMGAAIVSPLKWRAVVGTKVEVRWEHQTGIVLVRREAPVPGSTSLAMYGVEFAENGSPLAQALFERLVLKPARDADARELAEQVEAAATIPDTHFDGPVLWAAPVSWSPEARRG